MEINKEELNKLKEQLKEELRKELKIELIKNETLYNKKAITSSIVRNKYANKISDKFGATGNIDSAIRTVATYRLGERKASQIKTDKIKEWEESLDFLYKYVLGE